MSLPVGGVSTVLRPPKVVPHDHRINFIVTYLVDEERPVLYEETLQISKLAVLDDDHQFALGNVLRHGAQQVYDVEMLSQMNHNLQLGYQRFHHFVVGLLFNHFNGHCRFLLVGNDTLSNGLQNHSKSTSAKLFAELQFIARKFDVLIVRQQVSLFIEVDVGIDAFYISFLEVRETRGLKFRNQSSFAAYSGAEENGDEDEYQYYAGDADYNSLADCRRSCLEKSSVTDMFVQDFLIVLYTLNSRINALEIDNICE